MGRRGPKPKPSALKDLEGTYRPDRAPANEPKPEQASSVTPPADVAADADAKKLWEDLAPRLLRLGLFTELDTPELQGLCMAYSKAVQADRAVREYGVVVKSDFGLRANPAVQMSRAAWAEVRRWGAEFGMSPQARTRVEAEPDRARGEGQEQVVDSADTFLFGKVVGQIGGA
jgi:P27 family predicted phage terminase small subunit